MKMKKYAVGIMVMSLAAGLMTGCGGKASAQGKDITVISREDGSGTRSAFVELFDMEEEVDGEKIDMTTDEAQITNSTSVVLTTVVEDEYAIGYISLGSMNDTVNAVKIDGAEATAENVKNGSYSIARPFEIAVKKDHNNELVQDFITYTLSAEGQKIIEDNGYISTGEPKPYEGKGGSGKIVIGGSSSVSPVMEKLIEAYKTVNSGVQIELQTTDSTTGMTETISGNYDIGMASRALKDTEISGGLETQTIAMDGIAVIVNTDNTVQELSSEQVKGIYTGEILTWDEVSE